MKTNNLIKHITVLPLMAAAITCSSVLSGCTDLDEHPYTFADPSGYYKNEKELQSALYTVYSSFRSLAGDYKYIMKLECCTDFGQPAYTKENCNEINAWVGVNDPSKSFSNTWSRAYQTINRANTIIARGESVPMDETEKSKIFAQAKFLRAYSYFYVLRLFGGCPISDKYTEGIENLELPRNSVDEVYNKIITDLQWCETEGNLPQKGDAGYDNWRVTLGAVHALLGEVYLFKASMNNDAPEDLKLSKQYSYKVIENQKYDLVKPYTDLWYWFNANAKNNIESIFELQYAPVSGQDSNLHRQFGIGEISDPAIGSYMYHRFSPAAYRYEEYADNDDRKKCFLTYVEMSDGEHILQFDPSAKGMYNKYDKEKKVQWCTTGPGNVKYFDRITDAALTHPCANFYVLRYSEVLLNYAEAANKLQAGDGINELNLVRERAGLTPLSGLGQQELMMPSSRKEARNLSVKPNSTTTNCVPTAWANASMTLSTGALPKATTSSKTSSSFPQKSFLWKIPQSDFDSSNGAMEQNPDNVSDPHYPL